MNLLKHHVRTLCLPLGAVLTLMIALSGCVAQLAPAYDKAVVDGLSKASTEAMTLLAAVSAGTKADTFDKREDKYNAVIGQLDALALLVGARPMPTNKATEKINELLAKRGVAALTDDDGMAPSYHAIKKVAETLTKMRDTDQKQGLTAFEASAFKGQVAIYLDQAVTYENFLQR